MKLPQVQYRQVESLGRHDTGAIARRAAAVSDKGMSEQRIMNTMAEMAGNFIQRRQDAEYNDAIAQSKIEMSNFKTQYAAKQFYTADELDSLSDEQVRKFDISTDDNGKEVKVPRTNIPAYEVYPHLLQQKMEGMKSQISGTISNPHLRAEYLRTSDTLAAAEYMKASVAAEDAQQKYYFEVGVERINEAAGRQDMDTVMFLLGNLETDDLKKEQILKDAMHIAEVSWMSESIRSSDPEVVMAALAIYEDENYDGEFTEKQRQSAIIDLNQRMDTLRSEHEAKLTRDHAEVYNSLAVGVMDGTVNRAQLDEHYALWQQRDMDPNGINPKEHEMLVRSLKSRQKGQTLQADYATRFGAMLDGTIPADPSNKFDKDTIEWAVTSLELNHDNVVELSQIARGTGIMPEMLERRINGQLLNGNMEQKTAALLLYNNLQNEDPHLINPVSEAAKRKARVASTLVDIGMDPAQAITITEEYMKEVTPDREAAIMQTYRDADYNNYNKLSDMMAADEKFDPGIMGGMFHDAPDPNPYMAADFATLVETHLPLVGGDYDMATQIAYRALRDEWGYTEAGMGKGGSPGRRAVRHPPERVLGVSSEQVEMGIKAFAETHGLNADQIILHADRSTPSNQKWAIWTWDDENDVLTRHDTEFDGYKYVKKGIADHGKAETEKAAERERLRRMVINQHEALGDEFWESNPYQVIE